MDSDDILGDIISGAYNRAAWKAWRLSTSPETLESLAESNDEEVLLGVAWNPNTPDYILSKMTVNHFPRVITAARTALDLRHSG